jgi:hypothetical protein
MLFERFGRLAVAVIAPLFLFGCILTPGKFVSSLTINKDRSFTFAYKGEVISIDPASEFSKGMKDAGKDDSADDADGEKTDLMAEVRKGTKGSKNEKVVEPEPSAPDEDTERKRRAIAEALTKEAGYKSATYLGEGKFLIDYEVSGVLTHNFVYPFNSDAEILFPFIMIEVRNGNTVRMRAPGYANDSDSRSKSGMGGAGGGDTSKFLDGEFTLNTDAEIVSQNNENGAQKIAGRNVIKWKATPLTRDAPVAVLRFAK